jgi:hypothetical protein
MKASARRDETDIDEHVELAERDAQMPDLETSQTDEGSAFGRAGQARARRAAAAGAAVASSAIVSGLGERPGDTSRRPRVPRRACSAACARPRSSGADGDASTRRALRSRSLSVRRLRSAAPHHRASP